MKFYLGVTDNNWFHYLSKINPEDLNFWQPGGKTVFGAIQSGEPFLFKLRRPGNLIGGVGFFVKHTFLPIEIAWDTFGNRNGAETYAEFLESIKRLRIGANTVLTNPQIGCIVLTSPIFFRQEDWIELPADWKNSIVQGKRYSTEDEIGKALWEKVQHVMHKYNMDYNYANIAEPQYSQTMLKKVRIGQGAFRVMVTDAYYRRCSISGEKTLPVLEAAHIFPYADGGPNDTGNGLLLRSDLHRLFDTHYITISPDYKVEVSKRIKEEFENGREYYRYHGSNLLVLPNSEFEKPKRMFLEMHNNNFKG